MNKSLIEKVAKNIKKYRAEKGYSQVQLAVRAGITDATLSSIEVARTDTTLTKLNTIAQALGVRLTDLLDIEDE